MKQTLTKPGTTKFVLGLKSLPGVEVHRKSGTWSEYHGESALEEASEHKYIIVGLARHKNGNR